MMRALRETVTDMMALLGVACISYGLWMVYEPLVWLWVGACLLAVTVVRVRGSNGSD